MTEPTDSADPTDPADRTGSSDATDPTGPTDPSDPTGPLPGTPTSVGLARRVLAFAGLPFLSLLTPFLFLPVLARVAGAETWLAIAVGQSIGAFFALVVALGYNTVGPAMVALAEPGHRPIVLLSSIRARVVVFVPAALVAVAIAALVAPEGERVICGLMSFAMVLTGLSSSWYMIGLGRAGLIALFEILPRMIATLLAAVLLVSLGIVIAYPLLLILASVVGVGWFVARTVGALGAPGDQGGASAGQSGTQGGRSGTQAGPGGHGNPSGHGHSSANPSGQTVREVLRENRSAAATEIAAGAYNSLAITFVSLTASTAQAAAYVSGDKLYRIGQYSVSALGNALQGWVVEDQRREFARRTKRSFVLHAALGLIGLLVFALAGPWLSALLFGERVAIDGPTALAFGFATLLIALGTTLGRVTLVGLGARREFFVSVLIGATIGIPAILVLAGLFGAAGGAWGLALGEFASVTAQSIFVVRVWQASSIRTPDSRTERET